VETKAVQVNEDFSRLPKIKDIGRWYVTRFVENVAKSLSPGSSVLDAGAGECVYKRFFVHCEYKAIDLGVGETSWNYGNLDYVGVLHNMPIESNSFDAVLCTQVLEHLEWPRESVKEMYRVLKPSGRLFLTAPMSHMEHPVPYDFFRYTSFGLRSICEHAGFKELEIQPFGGRWTRWAYEMPRCLSSFPASGILTGKPNITGILLLPVKLVVSLMIPLFQLIFLSLDNLDKSKNDPLGWSLVGRK
jgi:SAM-dependent methyltransferase